MSASREDEAARKLRAMTPAARAAWVRALARIAFEAEREREERVERRRMDR